MREGGEGEVSNEELKACCWIEYLRLHLFRYPLSPHLQSIILSRGPGLSTKLVAKLRHQRLTVDYLHLFQISI